jgi:hypothetical protein
MKLSVLSNAAELDACGASISNPDILKADCVNRRFNAIGTFKTYDCNRETKVLPSSNSVRSTRHNTSSLHPVITVSVDTDLCDDSRTTPNMALAKYRVADPVFQLQ